MTVNSSAETLETTCCIAGGGPAGMMLGFLLARAGVDVLVLEKHADFFRDFRGDTVHPSTLEVMHELGLLDEFLKRPHQKVTLLHGLVGNVDIPIADFSHLRVHCPAIVLMPQWDFLDFIALHAKRYPNFHLRMEAEVTDLASENGTITGVIAKTPQGALNVKSRLTVGADGRHSVTRQRTGLEVQDLGAPIDVFWFRISRQPDDTDETLGRVQPGKIMVMLNRDDYWQCAYVISKGSAAEIREKGLEEFRRSLAGIVPFFADRLQEIRDWDDVKLLTVTVDRLKRWWRPGLLMIGDAAHAMSPIGGVGINLAVQDAVAAVNILAAPFRNGTLNDTHLAAVQKRREWPVRVTQRMQVIMQNRVISAVLRSDKPFAPPWQLLLLKHWPFLRRFPAWLVGIGVRPEHVQVKEAKASGSAPPS